MSILSLVATYVIHEEKFRDKAVIIEEDSRGDWIYVVLKGCVKVKKRASWGWITCYSLKEGDIFGEMGIFGKRKEMRMATMVAEGPVEVGILDRVRLEKEFALLSPQLKDLIKALVSRLGDSIKNASELTPK